VSFRERWEYLSQHYTTSWCRATATSSLTGTADAATRAGRRRRSRGHGTAHGSRQGRLVSFEMYDSTRSDGRRSVKSLACRGAGRTLPVRSRSSVTSLSLVLHFGSGVWKRRIQTTALAGKSSRLVPHRFFFYERLELRQVLFGLGVGVSARESPCRSMHILMRHLSITRTVREP
jgi:hypothetical protein